MTSTDTKVLISLNQDEALVLFEWIASRDASKAAAGETSAEQAVLWRLEGQLEKVLPVFSEDYAELLASARRAVLAEGH